MQSQAIFQALAQLDPAHKDAYQANLDGFIADINQLESDIRAALSGLKSPRFLVFHPAWGYFANAYGLTQVTIEKGGKEPGARSLAGLIDEARRDQIRAVFVQPQSDPRFAAEVARAIGGQVIAIDPLAHKVTLAGGAQYPYHKLVIAPGIDFDVMPGLEGLTQTQRDAQFPHAWKAGSQTTTL